MQEKSHKLEITAASFGLKINSSKTKLMRINNKNNTQISMDPNQLEDVTSFTYLGSVINIGGSEEDAKARIGKARTTFNILNKIWKTKNIPIKTKLKIFNSNVKSTLLYGSKTWKTTHHTQQTTDIQQPLSTMPPGNLLAQHHLKCQPLGTHQTRTNRDPNQEEKMEMDRPHTQKKKQINYKAGHNMEPTRQEKEGKT